MPTMPPSGVSTIRSFSKKIKIMSLNVGIVGAGLIGRKRAKAIGSSDCQLRVIADTNKDDKVDMRDIREVAKHFGETDL